MATNEVPTLHVDGRGDGRSSAAPPLQSGRGPLPSVRPASPAQSGGPQGAVSALPSSGGLPAQRPLGSGLSSGPSSRVRPASEALAIALAALAYGEGVRVGLLGDSGCGKSWLARAIVAAYLKQSRGLVAVANSKADPWPTSKPWPVDSHREPFDLVASPPVGRVVVFTPDAFGEALSLEGVAAWQWRLARKGWPSLVVYDEISDGAKDGRWLGDDADVSQLARVFTHGRRPGVSAVWGAQFAHQVPREAFEQSNVILCWHQAGNALAILKKRHYLEGVGVEEAIRCLPAGDSPPDKRGAFVLLDRSRPWNGRPYRL